MKKMGIIYGSSTGTCESIAQTIAEKLGVASVDVIDASKITTEKVESYDILLLGTSTWGDGEFMGHRTKRILRVGRKRRQTY